MGKFSEHLKEYFENTPKEQLDKDWNKIKHLNDIGPDVIEYCEYYKKMFGTELWIARDKVFNDLHLYDEEPIKDVNNGCFKRNPKSTKASIHLNEDAFWFFKEVTWENSPQKVKIELI